MLLELRQCFMEAYDDNQDGKIDIREVILICVDINVFVGRFGKIINRFRTCVFCTACSTFAHGRELSALVQIRQSVGFQRRVHEGNITSVTRFSCIYGCRV